MALSTSLFPKAITHLLVHAAPGWSGVRAALTLGPTSSAGSSADTVVRAVTALAGLAALVMAAAVPLTYLFAAHSRLGGSLEASATLHAAEVAELARANPSFWEFEGLQVSAPAGSRASAERRRVFDVTGKLIIESVPGEALMWPVLSHREPVLDQGRKIGEVESARSMRGALLMTVLLAAAAACIGGLIFVVLRVLPLRLLHQALERASFLASHDLLTGLPNRGLFADRLAQSLAMARRGGEPLAVLCLDLDRFKEVNDTLGHAAGDRLLKVVSARFSAVLRESDTLARLGGDEFAVIQPQARQPDAADALARRLVSALEEPVDLDGHQVSVGVSIGIALADRIGTTDPVQLMRDADLALYQAKEGGRGGYRFFSPEMNQKLRERRALEADLRVALAQGGFRLAYQPQVNLDTGAVIGAEALLRWERPGIGNMPPDRFISVAEETGLIGPIGTWALQEACREACTWPGQLTIAVNVSPVQFRQSGLYEAVVAALESSGLPPERLELEITEGVLLNDTEETLATLHRLRELGVKIAMDDFGTGYSSLGYLQKFPFDKVKIDRSFVRHLGGDRSAEAIVRAVVGMSHALGVHTIAEGVETLLQADMLRQKGCEEVQGFMFGKPMNASDFVALLGSEEVP
ncbi:putative bifunctional diguanylate cyclase/phosphodiesterase [Teichococcus vastitatis]|jgi:diguanylate cyclase (GGDEF)-like protein|uniref:EAL domain-containing protein n=1 Tax=Teichococcus vastitatis TaxID=2307076 RepID=A0ABS9WA35_9PROT|nr:EAL domain-containing protein [Pseudoroseomonas vastitatis]MCI0756164.1 EAL domain-containing protein [Pseudoroseomonas vastitatis]